MVSTGVVARQSVPCGAASGPLDIALVAQALLPVPSSVTQPGVAVLPVVLRAVLRLAQTLVPRAIPLGKDPNGRQVTKIALPSGCQCGRLRMEGRSGIIRPCGPRPTCICRATCRTNRERSGPSAPKTEVPPPPNVVADSLGVRSSAADDDLRRGSVAPTLVTRSGYQRDSLTF